MLNHLKKDTFGKKARGRIIIWNKITYHIKYNSRSHIIAECAYTLFTERNNTFKLPIIHAWMGRVKSGEKGCQIHQKGKSFRVPIKLHPRSRYLEQLLLTYKDVVRSLGCV